MIALAILSLAAPAPAPLASTPVSLVRQDAADEYATRLEEAGDDPDKLWDLHKWCKEQGKIMQARECLKKIVELAPDHQEARKALGHHFYDDQWFESYYALSEYKRAEEKRMLDEKGLVRFKDEWVPVEDEPYLRLGMVKDDNGEWVTKRELERREREAKYLAEGWKQQTDLVWVSPEDQGKWEEGLWKCGDQWLTMEQANDYHSNLGRWWTLPSGKGLFEIWSTTPFTVTQWAGWHADRTYADLSRAYGMRPEERAKIVVLANQGQYNTFAAGDQQSIPPSEVQGFSSVHYAYFAEAWFEPVQPPEYLGTGVALWNMDAEDVDPKGVPDPFGAHAVRHAAALAYAEAIDPSLNTISRFASAPNQNFPFQAFWGEKKIPFWLRIGVAAYCERYFYDDQADTSAGYSPWWARDWSLDNVRRQGGPMPFDQIFAMQLNPNDKPGSARRINQAGMLVSFILDGKCKPVNEAHEAFKHALRNGEDTAEADAALRKAIQDNEAAFHEYVKM